MAAKKPCHFLDNSGDTIRVFPRTHKTGSVRVVYMSLPVYDDNGVLKTPGEQYDMWLRPDTAQLLGEILITEVNNDIFEDT